MTSPAHEPGPPAIRASDADRERVAATVREAVGDGRLSLVEGDERLAGVYASIHRHDLEVFTRDLGPALRDDPTQSTRPARVDDRPATTTSVAIMGGSERKGVWTPGRTHTAVAVMGGVEVDLRHARLGGQGLTIVAFALMGGVEIDLRGADIGPGGVTIRAFAIMGGVDVKVDGRTHVVENGIGLMGGFSDSSGVPDREGGPVVHVTGFAIMGGVDITRKRTRVPLERTDERPGLPEGDGGRPGNHGP